ncbi:MAG: nuclear transport factor 2 family protein [Gracilimonas sp.]|uniref:nuclear transport factor 2 family protein n=1 Tax=Gracilimonas TaxID=649462 RepID=UPI001B23DE8F|nr:nuclear transport factor 2 family protein [Gracilimonas sp.]MBO6584948.1 nuclear transport factor 2 family protein [Gracilimonas sp.]MBO6615781.1 nuclear transport factor 2 family protein [Gracilimonas sp.]
MKKLSLLLICLFISFTAFAQTELELIQETLTDYIEGTANGEPDRLHKAFHPDFNLYTVIGDDSLRVWDGQDYISGFREGRKSTRIGRIISIDHENNAATAKVEIVMPNRGVYTDYFLLLKLKEGWKIIHKTYTGRDFYGDKE